MHAGNARHLTLTLTPHFQIWSDTSPIWRGNWRRALVRVGPPGKLLLQRSVITVSESEKRKRTETHTDIVMGRQPVSKLLTWNSFLVLQCRMKVFVIWVDQFLMLQPDISPHCERTREGVMSQQPSVLLSNMSYLLLKDIYICRHHFSSGDFDRTGCAVQLVQMRERKSLLYNPTPKHIGRLLGCSILRNILAHF